MLQDEWDVQKNKSFTSPLNPKQSEQLIIFADQIKNGSIRV